MCTYFPKEIVIDIDSRWRYQNKENIKPPYQNLLFSDFFSFKMQNKHKTLFVKPLIVLSGFVAVSIQFYFQYILDKETVPLSSMYVRTVYINTSTNNSKSTPHHCEMWQLPEALHAVRVDKQIAQNRQLFSICSNKSGSMTAGLLFRSTTPKCCLSNGCQ